MREEDEIEKEEEDEGGKRKRMKMREEEEVERREKGRHHALRTPEERPNLMHSSSIWHASSLYPSIRISKIVRLIRSK